MPLKRGKSRKTINSNTKKLINEGYPPKRAYAISMDKSKKK